MKQLTSGALAALLAISALSAPTSAACIASMSDSCQTQQPAADNDASKIDIVLWGNNFPVQFKGEFEGNAGSYGKFIRESMIDFWEAENGGIAMRCFDQCAYSNGRYHEYDYTYEGKRIGNKIVFDRRISNTEIDVDNPGEWETLDETKPTVLEIKSPTSFLWDGVTFNRVKD